MFQQLDTDRDGKLSRAEFEAGQKAMMDRAQRAFDTADADRDGSLSATEQQAFRQAMHAQMPSQEGPQRRRGGAPAQPSAPAQPGS
jgi:Ca2+-binding EF-hand superfamily protein